MVVAAREAGDPDRSRLLELHRAATEELRAERGGAVWAAETDRDGEPPFFTAERELVLAGTLDDTVVGYARTVVAGRLAKLTDVYVEPGFRELGVGEALLAAAIEWARAQGCTGIDAVVLPGMRASKNFFEAAGLVARLIVPHKSFDAPA